MQRTVLYLDLDDTVIRWNDGDPSGAPGLGDFLAWALDTFEVRWLTRWARNGVMELGLIEALSRMSGVAAGRLAHIQGLPWDDGDFKVDGIAWMEHVVLRRPFLWLEDETIGARALEFLAAHGFRDSYVCSNVTADAGALQRVHAELRDRFARGGAANADETAPDGCGDEAGAATGSAAGMRARRTA